MLVALLAFEGSANAAMAPNYARYCESYHRGSLVNYNLATREPLCTVRTKTSMMHYAVNVGEACRLTTGSRAFQRLGPGNYVCLGQAGSSPPQQAAGPPPNYALYCKTHHPGTFVNFYQGTHQPLCSKYTSKLSLLHYTIDIGEACRLTTGSKAFTRVAVGQYVCQGRARLQLNPGGRLNRKLPPNLKFKFPPKP